MSLFFPDAPEAPHDPAVAIRTSWPKHHTPAFQRLLGLRIEVAAEAGRASVHVPLPAVLVVGAVTAALCLLTGLYLAASLGPINWLSGTLAVASVLPAAGIVLLMAALAQRSQALEAVAAPSRTVTITKRTLRGVETESFRATQIDSLLIVERRDLKNRRVYSLELCTNDDRNRELFTGFPPADLDRAARALRAAIAQPVAEGTDRIPLARAA